MKTLDRKRNSRDKQNSYLRFQQYSQDIRSKIAERLFNDAEKEGLLDCHSENKKCTDEEKENEFKIVKGNLLQGPWIGLIDLKTPSLHGNNSQCGTKDLGSYFLSISFFSTADFSRFSENLHFRMSA